MLNQFLVKILKKFYFNLSSDKFAKVIYYITFKQIKFLPIYRAEHAFNRKMRYLIQGVCNHPKTYKDHYWSGGFVKCSVCWKSLETLWLPTVVEKKPGQ